MKIRMRQLVVGAALVGAVAAGSAMAASAITGDTGSTDTTIQTPVTEAPAATTPANGDAGSAAPTNPAADDGDGRTGGRDGDGHHGGRHGGGRHGSPEEVLTGDLATKVEAAAKAAVPGATVERLEKDADGTAPYEAHMEKADGTHVTVYVNADFSVKSIEEGRPGCDDKDTAANDSTSGDSSTESAASSTAQV